MKKLFFLGLAIVLFTACEKQDKRYTQQSSEIDTVKQLITGYNNQEYNTAVYADTSKTNYNSKDDSLTREETISYHKENDINYSKRGFRTDDQEYEMVVTDDGETWVNCWLDWEATMKASGKNITFPVHVTYQFVDGKIVREVGFWDPTEVVMDLLEQQALKGGQETE